MLRGQDPVVASSSSIADVMEWSDKKPEEVDAPVLRGLGELRARKPGQTKEKDHAVRLAKHAVKVRVVDIVARTEVDETFANDTDEELEGIFRFPLPPGAQIERLALEVDGKLMEGAFVDRDKGAAIWRGVIQNAAPKAPKPREEIIWVPGPWRDPALLEWQRGGRFELRIFPIPKRGLAAGHPHVHADRRAVRRHPPLHVPARARPERHHQGRRLRPRRCRCSASTRASACRRAATISPRLGRGRSAHDARRRLRPRRRSHGRVRAPRSRQGGHGVGLLDVGPRRRAHDAADAPAGKAKAGTADEKLAVDNAAAIANDGSPYVAIAVRPKLPRWQEPRSASTPSSSTRAARCSASASPARAGSPRRSSARWIGATPSSSSPATPCAVR
jgi:hypothetical protein